MISQCISGASPNRTGKKIKPMIATHVPAASAIIVNIRIVVASAQPSQRIPAIICTIQPTPVLAFWIGSFITFLFWLTSFLRNRGLSQPLRSHNFEVCFCFRGTEGQSNQMAQTDLTVSTIDFCFFSLMPNPKTVLILHKLLLYLLCIIHPQRHKGRIKLLRIQ